MKRRSLVRIPPPLLCIVCFYFLYQHHFSIPSFLFPGQKQKKPEGQGAQEGLRASYVIFFKGIFCSKKCFDKTVL
jgi:hypothetical protein